MPPDPDVVIVGSGMGGATLAFALRDSGARVLILERGDYLPPEPENWDVDAVFRRRRYMTQDTWLDDRGRPFSPETYYVVGGNTKVFGATLGRLRAGDFDEVEHEEGTSPAWPIAYGDLSPFYDEAERLFGVHGTRGEDPTDPPAARPFPQPAIPHEAAIERLHRSFAARSLHPYHLPMAVDVGPGGTCILCGTCDAFPCKLGAKFDAERACLRTALESPTVELSVRTTVRRLVTDPQGGRVEAVEIERDGQRSTIRAGTFVLAAGAVNSAVLLLASANDAHPRGLANSSDQVGRNYMTHINTVMMSIDPRRRNLTTFQKTLGINDFYAGDDRYRFPMGNIQLLGKITPSMIAHETRALPHRAVRWITDHSVDWWIMSEDLPTPNNRVTVGVGDRPQIRWHPRGLGAHHQLVGRAKRLLRKAGYPVNVSKRMGIDSVAHQCGTARFGVDPRTSVLDPFCKTHDIDNLYVVDASFFPSSGAMNPSLTIAAQALRCADRLVVGR